MRILIVGGGKVAEELLRRLDLKRHQVYVVEKDPVRRQEISSNFDVFVIGKDATDVSLYTTDLQMEQIDMVIALTGSNEVNLLVLAIAKLYNVPHRIAKVTDHRMADLLYELELGIPVTQSSIVASMISNYLESVVSSLPIGSFGDYYLHLISLAETDMVVGSKIKELNLPEDIRILLVFDGRDFKPPMDEIELKPGYQLIVLSKIRDIEKYFKG
ncbi:TrkA-N domain protein [Staphylothermus marinus F1]|uniref:TrkA-N domain protein n=1 Tax=Staphylothermus marinus (strain ATCC 43588 / DSM 3639 / JCM 9404 / F1) TaxID=399550 RepID=A3DNI5_STAMF|nr:NAD-binding protein [Staphylothermus marinus]ABN70195.1 TrkA-N domain protein [Staphylothermus marinus F1]